MCLRLVELMRKGVEKPAAQAKEIGVDVEEIYKAKKRLAGHVRGVASDLGVEKAEKLEKKAAIEKSETREERANEASQANQNRGDA